MGERTRIKMCGMTRREDIEHAIRLGVDAIGLIFYEQSSRYVELNRAKQLIQNLPPFVSIVAVLVNPDEAFVKSLLEQLPIHVLQFHGDESPAFCDSFGMPYYKTIHPQSAKDVLTAAQDYPNANALLLDAMTSHARGGTGVTFDWRMVPIDAPKPIIVAGGLNAHNVVKAVAVAKPYAVDVCSGIEASSGVKDLQRMEQFVVALHQSGTHI